MTAFTHSATSVTVATNCRRTSDVSYRFRIAMVVGITVCVAVVIATMAGGNHRLDILPTLRKRAPIPSSASTLAQQRALSDSVQAKVTMVLAARQAEQTRYNGMSLDSLSISRSALHPEPRDDDSGGAWDGFGPKPGISILDAASAMPPGSVLSASPASLLSPPPSPKHVQLGGDRKSSLLSSQSISLLDAASALPPGSVMSVTAAKELLG